MGTLSEGKLSAALLHAETLMPQAYGRMPNPVAEAVERGMAGSKGYPSTRKFLAVSLRLSAREAKARVAYVTTAMPLTPEALAAGTINAEHVTEIHRALSQAPADISEADLVSGERTLITPARQALPLSVRAAGERLPAFWNFDTGNLVLACDCHHRLLHHSDWSIRMADGIPQFIPPKWLDQEQKPIRNTAHTPDCESAI